MEKNGLITLDNVNIPKWNELPNVDLYLDQVVTYINKTLSELVFLLPSNDKKENQLITKTMINNYVKNNLIEAPVKKKYSKTQCAKIFVICILKQVYSMNDIAKLINIALENTKIEQAYDSFCNHFKQALVYVYNNKTEFGDIKPNNDRKYLLKAVLISCCYKIYTQNIINLK